ncbi:MAG: hypothetical protein C3F13_13570 [Anaerolineales bacterium]|nr:MAG: hypothetical protein C3F13_13570 [Anaerolineales bacterium]
MISIALFTVVPIPPDAIIPISILGLLLLLFLVSILVMLLVLFLVSILGLLLLLFLFSHLIFIPRRDNGRIPIARIGSYTVRITWCFCHDRDSKNCEHDQDGADNGHFFHFIGLLSHFTCGVGLTLTIFMTQNNWLRYGTAGNLIKG